MTRRKIRLLVVDDSPYMQMAIRAMVAIHPEIEIVGEAVDGEEAVELATRLRPDVITMDVNMPGLDGLEAARRIMAQAPTQIIMLSTLTEKGVVTTFQALELGAVDYVPKSSSAIDVDLATIAGQVAAKILFWGRQGIEERLVAELPPPAFPADADILVIAAGSGGPRLVGNLLRVIMPLSFPVLVVQEMPADFTVPFVDFLGRLTGHPTRECAHRSNLATGTVTVMPGGRRGSVYRDPNNGLSVSLGSTSTSGRGEDDVIVSAVAATRTPAVILLSGEARPLDRLAAAWMGKGGTLWVQSPESCVVEALPRAAIAIDVPKTVVEPRTLVAALSRTIERSAA